MRLTLVRAGVSGVALFLLSGPYFLQAATPNSPNKAEQLVRAALEAEIAGNPAERTRLLDEALKLDPEFGPARWHSGFVRIDDQWVKLDDVPQHTAGDEVLAAYRKKRDAMVDTADNHRELARWCKKNRLADEARVHWAHVLEFEPQNAEALVELGLELYAGRLMTRSQIQAEKIAAGERMQAMRAWRPQLVKYRRAIESGVPRRVDEALRGLAAISDPAAIPALKTVFAVDKGENVVDLNRALIETLERIQDPAATEALLRRAVLGEPEEVRDLAIAGLKKRPMHSYVPRLIAAIPGKLQTRSRLYFDSFGTLVRQQELHFENTKFEYNIADEAYFTPDLSWFISRNGAYYTPENPGPHLQRLMAFEAAADDYRQWSERLTGRIRRALAETTGFADSDDPAILEQYWSDYNGWYSTRKPKQRRSTFQSTFTSRVVLDPSCFPPGTLVSTMNGDTPIEEIRVGDRVLSQDSQSGELFYKPVHATTLRPSTQILEISLGGNTIRSTIGHPFWVVGHGWRLAKDLEPGDRLHTLTGAVEVTAVGTGAPSEAYNLIVADSHDYFAGESGVLAHDNSPLGEPAERIPGLAAAGP